MFDEGISVGGFTDDTCLKSARNALLQANHFDSSAICKGYIDVCLKELCERVKKPFFTSFVVDRKYKLHKIENDSCVLEVFETTTAECHNPTDCNSCICTWQNMSSVIIGTSEFVFDGIEIEQQFYIPQNNTYTLDEDYTLKRKMLDPTIVDGERKFSFYDLYVPVPKKSTRRIITKRRFFMPASESESQFDVSQLVWKSSFSVSFFDVNVVVFPVLYNCILCDERNPESKCAKCQYSKNDIESCLVRSGVQESCQVCDNKDQPVSLSRFQNGARIDINDWVSSETVFGFSWNYESETDIMANDTKTSDKQDID